MENTSKNRTENPFARDENWRFARVSDLFAERFSDAPQISQKIIAACGEIARSLAAGTSGFIGEIDGKCVYCDIAPEAASVCEYRSSDSEKLPPKTPGLSMKFFADRIASGIRETNLLTLPDDVVFEKPFVLVHWISASDAELLTAARIRIGARSRAKFCEYFLPVPGTETPPRSRVLSRTEFILGENAELRTDCVQTLDEAAEIFRMEKYALTAGANLHAASFGLGGARARTTTDLELNGENAFADVRTLNIASGTQEIDWRTIQHHAAPNAESHLLCKNALLGNAKTIFAGNILVDEIARGTAAVQSCRNLILSETAEAHSLPGLEISASDVRCSHGATTGTLDPEQLFYLLQRGLPETEARRLLTLGFMDEIVSAGASEQTAELVRAAIAKKFV